MQSYDLGEVTMSNVIVCEFPDDLIKMIRNYTPISPASFHSEVSTLKKTVSELWDAINSDKSWREEFKAGLKENNDQIRNLGIALENIAGKLGKEIDERKENDAKLKMQASVIKGIGLVLSAIFGGGLISLVVLYVAKILRLD
jgi:hypothetical protein